MRYVPADRRTLHPVRRVPKPGKQKETQKQLVAPGRGKHEEDFFSSSLVLHPAQSPSSGLPPSAHIGLSLILFLSCALSLCGILAAILALGSHLSFGGTHAFLLADGTPTHTHRNRHTCLQSTLALKHRPSGLKDKKTYRGRAALTQGRLFTVL